MSHLQSADKTYSPVPSSEGSPHHVHKRRSRHGRPPSWKAEERRSPFPSALKKKRSHRHGSAFSARLPGSALATIDESRLSRISRWKLCVVVATPCVFLGVSILLMHLFVRGSRTQLARQKQLSLWVQQLGNACATQDCERAVSELKSSIDASVDPCQDFYTFACGRWGHAKHDASYMAVQRTAYIANVNASLWNTGHFGFSNDGMRQMSAVYRSCLKFFDRQPVNIEEAWSVSGIEAHFWLSVSSFDSLFTLLVGNVLAYNLESVVNVRWRDDADSSSPATFSSVEVSAGTAIARHLDQSYRKALIIRALEAVGEVAYHHLLQIEHIDDTVLELTPETSSMLPTKEVSVHDLDTASANWSRVLFGYAKLMVKPAPSKARVRNLHVVREVLEFLGRGKLRAVAVYLALVPLAKFFVLAKDVQLRVISSQEYDENVFKYEACVRALELFFEDSYRQWMFARMEGSGTMDDVNQIFTDVLTAARNFSKVFSHIPLDDKRISAPPYFIKRSPEDVRNASNSLAEANGAPTQFSTDFISNTILFSRQRSRNSGGDTCEPLLTIDSIVMRWNDTESLLRLLLPDFYHAGASEAAVNYGTLGYYLGTVAFQAAVAENWTSSSDYGPCLADYVHSQIGLSLHELSWDYIVGRHWAVQVALEAAVSREADFSRSKHIARLFFLRFAQTCCSRVGLPRQYDDVHEMVQSPESCNAVAMTGQAFAGAFDCLHMPPMDC
ncbi:uncharacterized protein LOC144103330 [Amblyomma americanum]